ncbi:uncharacterized protein [Halyomorpha halys]|uniref:uncharacterized protein n=1 Tax=Halyomorpha halys TaxID=286706 RepID=UPI0006D4C9B5|nr:uncharacterized protein LOC106685437 [Halyomorpha halys]
MNMMQSLALLLIAISGVSSSTQWDWEAFTNELKKSSLRTVGAFGRKERYAGSIFNESCKCEGISCQCCAKPKLFGSVVNGCIKFTPDPINKKISIGLTALNRNIFTHSFSITKLQTICGNLPGSRRILTYCFKSSMVGDKVGVTLCGKFEIRVRNIIGVAIEFRCINLKNGGVTFSKESPSINGIIEVKTREPFKKLLKAIKEDKFKAK